MRRPSLLFLSALLMSGMVLADDPVLGISDAAPPEGISEEMRAVLRPQALEVSINGELQARIWVREQLTEAAQASSELGVAFGNLEAGSLVGVLELATDWSDDKESLIGPGVYTLRYCVMPADGNHMGVSIYRDYVLLIPPASDTDPEQVLEYGELVMASLEATGVPHPGVLALFPIWDEIEEPKLVKNEVDQWTLAVKLGTQVIGLVVSGHGES
jgi:hypothetical protein